MALNEAVPRLSAGPFSGIMGDIGECRNRVFIDQRKTDNY